MYEAQPIGVEGLTAAEFRAHPITELFQSVGFHGRGALPTEAELEVLKVAPDIVEQIATGCDQVLKVKDTTSNAEAWALADELSARVISRLPERQRRPDYLQVRQSLTDERSMAPDELAARVGRHGMPAETGDPDELAAKVPPRYGI